MDGWIQRGPVFPGDGDQLRRGESGQGDDDGVGFGHAKFEEPVSYPSNNGQWVVS